MEFLKLTKISIYHIIDRFCNFTRKGCAICDHFSQELTGEHSYHRISQKITENHRKSQSITGYHKTLKDHSRSQEITEYHRRSQKPWKGLHSESQPKQWGVGPIIELQHGFKLSNNSFWYPSTCERTSLSYFMVLNAPHER